ncbi:MAG: hypothetical protein IKU53_05140 [Firmicutes bacterium]|nr:hypothetical protein [Bacillota bacterium]
MFSNPETYGETIAVLDEKSSNVLALATSSAAISTGLTMLPGDTASPMADQMADLSSTMMIIMCAIFLEKYLLTLAGVVSCCVLIPIGLAFIVGAIHTNSGLCKVAASKLIILAICLLLVVPVSTAATGFIENTYDISMEQRLEDAANVADKIEQNTNENENIAQKLLDKLTGGVTGLLDEVKATFRDFIEITALMIVTSCVMPILTLVALVWILNLIVGISIPVGKVGRIGKSGSVYRRKLAKVMRSKGEQ